PIRAGHGRPPAGGRARARRDGDHRRCRCNPVRPPPADRLRVRRVQPRPRRVRGGDPELPRGATDRLRRPLRRLELLLDGGRARLRAARRRAGADLYLTMDDAADAPEISIVIPVYNEEAILHAAVVDLRERLHPFRWSYEVVLAENGSRDA